MILVDKFGPRVGDFVLNQFPFTTFGERNERNESERIIPLTTSSFIPI